MLGEIMLGTRRMGSGDRKKDGRERGEGVCIGSTGGFVMGLAAWWGCAGETGNHQVVRRRRGKGVHTDAVRRRHVVTGSTPRT